MTDGYARRALGGSAQASDPEAPGQGRRVEGLAVPWTRRGHRDHGIRGPGGVL